MSSIMVVVRRIKFGITGLATAGKGGVFAQSSYYRAFFNQLTRGVVHFEATSLRTFHSNI